ncbi:MAG: hypothetical protein WAT22_15510 [Saprospiraceae bacterium]
MNYALFSFAPNIIKDIYLKDPFSSELGRSIIKESIEMIDDLGFEEFTFKKLAIKIKSTEATVYSCTLLNYKKVLYD